MQGKHANGTVLVNVIWKRLFIGLCVVVFIAACAACVYKFTDTRYFVGGGTPMILTIGTTLMFRKLGI